MVPWCPEENLLEAVRDYRFLLDRGYPVHATIKLIGDRFRLNKAERIVLLRGVLEQHVSARIAERILEELPEKASLCVDGYNVLFTIANYRAGHPLFIGTDGLLRDAGGAHGRFSSGDVFCIASGLLAEELAFLDLAEAMIYLDAPVSSSGDHAAAIRAVCGERKFPVSVEVVASADPCVCDFAGTAVASSDSVIAVNSRAPVFDLSRNLLERRFKAAFQNLRTIRYPERPGL